MEMDSVPNTNVKMEIFDNNGVVIVLETEPLASDQSESKIKGNEKLEDGTDVPEIFYKCLKCEKCFISLEDLRVHRHYSDLAKLSKKRHYKPFKCNHCDLAYTTLMRLEKHMAQHGMN